MYVKKGKHICQIFFNVLEKRFASCNLKIFFASCKFLVSVDHNAMRDARFCFAEL